MIISEEYIKSFTEENLWQLTKDDLEDLANSMNIEFKKSETKDSILSKIKNDDNYNLLDIYNRYKNWCFGLYPTRAQELLGIDNKTLKKLAKRDIIKIAYYRDQKLYGKHIDVPYYLLESLLISKEELNKAIEWYCKKATEKQLAAITKVRETSLKNRTCIKCNNIVGKKSDLYDGKCRECISNENFFKHQEFVRFQYKEFIDNTYS